MIVAALLCLSGAPTAVQAQGPTPNILRDVKFEQLMDAQVPLDAQVRTEDGQLVSFGSLLNNKPTVLTLNYLHCKNLCPIILDTVVGALADLPMSIGKDYNVITLSIDPRELPALAASKKKQYVRMYARDGAENGWHFLTSDTDDIHAITDAVGFHYVYDAQQDEFAHPAGIIVLTAAGKVSRYLYGTEIPSQDIRLALVEASNDQIGSPVDQLLLVCYHYDPSVGRYSTLALDVTRWLGLATVGVLGVCMFALFRWDRRHYRQGESAQPAPRVEQKTR